MENNSKLKSSFAILFVDDEEKLRKYFAMSIQKDFEVLCAENVEEAKKILAEHHDKIGVVLTDQRMPGGNGVILLKHLKEEYPHIIRLLTTAYSDLSDAIDAINKGEIIRYIQKPWDFTVLANELSAAMELFELRLQCDSLLKEKFAIKKKTEKLNRVKLLMSMSGVFLGLKNAQRSVADYVRHFVLSDHNEENIDDNFMQSSDMGGKDVEEVKALSNMVLKVVSEINNNHDLSEFRDVDLKDIISRISNNNGVKIVFEDLLVGFLGNAKSLTAAFSALTAVVGSGSEIKIGSMANGSLVVKGSFVGFEHNISFLNDNALLFCLFAGHNGFEIVEFDSSGFMLKLGENKSFDDEDLDNLILSAIL